MRVRPFNGREKERNAELIVNINGQRTSITNPENGKVHDFDFDKSYWSHDGFEEHPETKYLTPIPGSKYADQDKVFKDFG